MARALSSRCLMVVLILATVAASGCFSESTAAKCSEGACSGRAATAYEGATDQEIFIHLLAGEPAPLSTSTPVVETSQSSGTTTHTISCVQTPAGPQRQEFHTFYAYPTASQIYYGGDDADYQPYPGVGGDIQLASSAINLTWLVEMDAAPTLLGRDLDGVGPGAALPEVTVRGTLRTGGQITASTDQFDEGELLARGTSEPALLAGELTDGATYHFTESGKHVYEFHVPLQASVNQWRQAASFNLRVEVMVNTGVEQCDGNQGYLMPNTVAMYSGPGLAPALSLPISNPLTVDYFEVQSIDSDLVFHAAVASIWGQYDVNLTKLQFEIVGPSRPAFIEQVNFGVPHRSHGEVYGPMQTTFIWPHALEEALPGEYEATFYAENLQGLASAIAVTSFTILDDEI